MIERIFVCIDCGVSVRLVAPDPDQNYLRCGPCYWLDKTPDPAERERIKGMTHRRDMADG
jgi:hypothetical protein